MEHKCDKCDNEATVHEVTIHAGKKVQKHLCEQCAVAEGIESETGASVNKLVSGLVLQTGPSSLGKKRALRCSECGMTFAEFKQKGLLGCGGCYQAFEKQVAPLIERAQEGGLAHVGKTPKNVGVAQVRQSRLAELRRQLADALTQEKYESAAAIRDEIYEVDPEGTKNPLGPYETSDGN